MLLLIGSWLSLLAPQTTSAHVRLDPAVAQPYERLFQQRGYEILHLEHGGAVEGYELILTPSERPGFDALELPHELVAEGRPLREALAEGGGTEGTVPGGYLDLAGIYAQMAAAAAAFPGICTFVDLTAAYGTPTTFEGRSLFAVKISDNVAQDEDEPAFLMVSAHHCRETVTPVLALDALDRLTSGYGSDPVVTQLVDANEIWIAPVWNPDGYEHVFAVDNLWRKNRRVFAQGVGVDLNRNYPTGWANACSGSSVASSQTYKGPQPASEPETQTLLAWIADRRFAKVLDYHSSGREVLWGYACPAHPFDAWWQAEATALSVASGYGGAERPPSADGEHYQTDLAQFGAFAFLTETATEFQPAFPSAQAEVALVWPGTVWLLERPIPVSGRVLDACSGAPLDADVDVVGVTFQNGETNSSFGPFGRYHAFLPPGSHVLRFDAPGYASQDVSVDVVAGTAHGLDVALLPEPDAYCTPKVHSQGCAPAIAGLGSPSTSSGAPFTIAASLLVNQKPGLLFYGFAGAALPFFGGTLCVAPPLRRTAVQSSAGNPPPDDCSGTYAFDMNAWIQSGSDPNLTLGAGVFAQYWGRDPADAAGVQLSDGLAFDVCR